MNESGARLFCRYAYEPNERGFCGPAESEYLQEVARGEATDEKVRDLAKQFSGAWVYQQVIAELTGLDPLDADVVRTYWIGSPLNIDRAAFWLRLAEIVVPKANAYWSYLDDSLAKEAAPNHAFHVLGVYPWTRLLSTGRPEPVQVLNSCLIRPGEVTKSARRGETVEAETQELVYVDGQLGWRSATVTAIAAFDDIANNDLVALHWDGICGRLSAPEASTLAEQLADQVKITDQRLRKAIN